MGFQHIVRIAAGVAHLVLVSVDGRGRGVPSIEAWHCVMLGEDQCQGCCLSTVGILAQPLSNFTPAMVAE